MPIKKINFSPLWSVGVGEVFHDRAFLVFYDGDDVEAGLAVEPVFQDIGVGSLHIGI